MPEGKFYRVDQFLRVAVGMEFTKLPAGVSISTPGVAEVRHYPPRNSQKVYFNLNNPDFSPFYLQVKIPTFAKGAPYAEILFNNNRVGAQVLFGRKGEEAPFGPTEGKYVFLRLYRESEHPFKTVYARVDKGPETYFFALKARWEKNNITIEIERSPSEIPDFLT